MEYVFGTKGEIEVLKVKAGAHTDLTGYHQIEQTYPDQTITDCFRIVQKLDSQEDGAGNCYDWYEIDRHYRVVDKTGPLVERAAEATTSTENAICELDAITDGRLAAVEDALCELDGRLGGEAK